MGALPIRPFRRELLMQVFKRNAGYKNKRRMVEADLIRNLNKQISVYSDAKRFFRINISLMKNRFPLCLCE
tara:strand:- start:60 stop:272 length:213 start_codon:yes stop_codon:yes gene_type:complete